MSKLDFDSNKKQRYIAGALVIALCLGGSYGCSRCSKTDIPEDALASELVSDDEVIPPTNLILQSEDFVKSSCPVICHITGVTMDNEDVDFYHAIFPADEGTGALDTLTLVQGAYNIVFIPSISENGSVVSFPTVNFQVEKVSKEDLGEETNEIRSSDVNVVAEGSTTPSEEVSKEMIQAIVEDTTMAVESGKVDETLTGDCGKDILDAVCENVENNVSIADNVKDDIKEQVDDVEVSEEADHDVIPTPVSNKTSTSSHGSSNSSTTSNTSSSSSSSSSSNYTKPSPKPAPVVVPSKPKPTPKPVDKPTKKKVWVVDKKAYDEQVKVKDAYSEKVCVSKAYDEQVKVKDGWSEQVKVKDAWSEKVKVKDAVYKTTWSSRFICSDGHVCYSMDELESYLNYHDVSYSNDPVEHKTLVSDAKYETVYHDAQYKTVYHDPQYKTVHHDAKYKTVNYPAQYKTVHHNEQGHWEWK